MPIPVTFEFGLLVRKAALAERKISVGQLLQALDAQAPRGEDSHLLAFGPSFGQEANDEFVRRLKKLGLE